MRSLLKYAARCPHSAEPAARVPFARGTLYNTAAAPAEVGWLASQGRQRLGNRSERTVYAPTEAGHDELARRLDSQIRHPEREFSQFLGAVTYLGALGASGAVEALAERAERLRQRTAADESRLAEALAAGVPRLQRGLAGGPPDDPALVSSDRLQGRPGRPFLVRAYTGFDDATRLGGPHATATPTAADQYAVQGRRLDLVAQYRSTAADVDGYCDFLREPVEQYGALTSTLQVTEEPDVTSNPTLDGYYPAVREALVRGVRVVKARAREIGYTHLRVGFNTTPLFGPATSFVTDLTSLGGEDFIADLDYVGPDFFPDVFRPVDASGLAHAVEGLLRPRTPPAPPG